MSSLLIAERPKVTAWHLIRAVMRDRYRRNFCVPNYAPRGWWECDVFELTPGRSFREYEVKLTLGDFRKDADKDKWAGRDWIHENGEHRSVERPRPRKHELLETGDPGGPQRFWFVTPIGLLAPPSVPRWAGLIQVTDGYGITEEIVKAPVLHREPFPKESEEHARGICYWRMHNLFWKAT